MVATRNPNSAFLLLVGEDVGTRYPGMVIDGDVDEFPACALTAAIAGAASSDAMANTVEAAEFFDVEMDDFAGPLALVARVGFLRLEAGDADEAAAFEHARVTGFADIAVAFAVVL